MLKNNDSNYFGRFVSIPVIIQRLDVANRLPNWKNLEVVIKRVQRKLIL